MLLLPGRSDITDVTAFIATASAIVDDLEAKAAVAPTATILEQIEKYISAHLALVTHDAGALAAMTVGEAVDRYHNVYDLGLKMTRPGQVALMLDRTGYLNELDLQMQKNIKPALFQVI
jgi:hypothetical protein